MVIRSNLLLNMGMIINFRDKIPLKTDRAIQNKDVCCMLYSMHTNAPILKEAEEWAERILDANYSKVNINEMIDDLDIKRDIKQKLKDTLKKFPNIFGGGLGKLNDSFSKAHITLKAETKAHASMYYTMPRAYEKPAKKEIHRMCDVQILKKLHWDNDTPWAAALFCQMKKTNDL